MRSFILRSLSFILFFVTFFVVVNAVFFLIIAVTDWDWKKRIESLRFENPDYELLVLGSSLTQYGVDTEMLTSRGIKSYNFALVGNTVRGSYVQLREYLTNYEKKPGCVILAVNSYLEKLDGDNIQPVVEYTMKDYKHAISDFPLLRFTNWFGGEILKKILSRKHRETVVSYGQIKREKITPDKSKYQENYLNLDKIQSSRWIGEIVKLCKQKGVEIMIIEIPAVTETQNVSELGPHMLEFENGYSARLYNLNTQDFCRFIDPARDWVGDSHFNPAGARKFTEELFEILKKDTCMQNINSLTYP